MHADVTVEPGEEPSDAVEREVLEELGIRPSVCRIIGAYGGPELVNTYPNGDEVSYMTVAYECRIPSSAGLILEHDELIETAWVRAEEIRGLPHHEWIDRVITDTLDADELTRPAERACIEGKVLRHP